MKQLNQLAWELVSDNKSPNVFFVSLNSDVVLVTIDFQQAYNYWLSLPRDTETTLEDRTVGTLAYTEPITDGSKRYQTIDDTYMLEL